MREIKFRAWHNRRMYDVNTLGMNLDGINNCMCFAHAEYQSMKKMRNGCVMFNGATKIMQYTGLKDKNGKEIYEGDVVFHPEFLEEMDHGQGSTYKDVEGEVKFMSGCFEVCDIPLWVLLEGIDIAEVIGNIYENPELI